MAASAGQVVRGNWCWRRWIGRDREDFWMERLRAANCFSWALMERPDRRRILLEAYVEARAIAVSLTRRFGGQMRRMEEREWIDQRPTPPTRIGRRLEIIHEKKRGRKAAVCPQLHIPHGVAFGSGEHATTRMLLGALARHREWNETSVLDLGTGSGVLALAARLFGARKIVATDFAPEAVRTARQNEALNFTTPLIRWHCSDVKQLRARVRYDLVLANLFSGILCEAAAQIAGCVSSDGQLWLSGILRSQEEEVMAAYRRQKLQPVRSLRRGKWVMLQWRARLQ